MASTGQWLTIFTILAYPLLTHVTQCRTCLLPSIILLYYLYYLASPLSRLDALARYTVSIPVHCTLYTVPYYLHSTFAHVLMRSQWR